MTPERWRQVSRIYHETRARRPEERAPFLASVCMNDESLQRDVESLFGRESDAVGFLSTPAMARDNNAMRETGRFNDSSVTTYLDGQQIAGYELVALIGAGGMGEVYKAHDKNLERSVALKLLPLHLTHDPERLRRFRAEARAASSLNHPHILVVHDFGEFNGRPFMVTEFVEGQTLRQRINADPIDVREAVDITIQVASGLAAAHARGIVHRDIKPENVMLRPDGYVKVLDFGLARQMISEETTRPMAATQPGTLVGTLRYMSPEQSRGQGVHAPSDVFSLGLVLFEMVTGRHPFHADSSIGVLHGIQSSTPAASGGGGELDHLLLEMLQKDPSLRPAAADVVARLTGFATRARP